MADWLLVTLYACVEPGVDTWTAVNMSSPPYGIQHHQYEQRIKMLRILDRATYIKSVPWYSTIHTYCPQPKIRSIIQS